MAQGFIRHGRKRRTGPLGIARRVGAVLPSLLAEVGREHLPLGALVGRV
jgi:hypothetical protein